MHLWIVNLYQDREQRTGNREQRTGNSSQELQGVFTVIYSLNIKDIFINPIDKIYKYILFKKKLQFF
ncbi:hypothetical protein BJP34_35505 [Moorena producens PAL-8-15-08-1]|uniref:Uncharacterized protein n=1 Tax=Moorena producens PAL-8-15-08-1 TaxID=1458985 RepID=A0A1D8U2I1_9CYAN|nr:hypothetical protein BJP34_35505 [Moorena producens PAL-8-15-08-1]